MLQPIEILNLAGRRFFLTGATGFLGRSVLDYIIRSVAIHGSTPHVTVLSRAPRLFLRRFPAYARAPWLNFCAGDLENLPDSLPGQFTDVIHAAADTSHGGDSLKWLDQLVGGTRAVLDLAVASHAERFLFVSSGAVYGRIPSHVDKVREDASFAPLPSDVSSVYAQGKRMSEHLCALYAQKHGIRCVVARCFALVSEHIPLHGVYAVGNFLRDAIEGREIKIIGDGSAVRTYIDGRDASHWLLTLLEKGSVGDVYNVGSDEPVTILEVANLVAKIANRPITIAVKDSEITEQRPRYVPDIQKAAMHGLKVCTPLDRAISDAFSAIQLSYARKH